LARLARTQLGAGQSCIIEGNWRSVHASMLSEAVEATRARACQIWCRADPVEIVRRFTSRRRHAGHQDALLPGDELERAAALAPAFLDLVGPRWVYRSDFERAYEELLPAFKSWRL
jgi:hypothetical protein